MEELSALDKIKARQKARQPKPSASAPPNAAQPVTLQSIIEGLYDLKTDKNKRVESVNIRQTGFLALLRWLGFRRYDVQESFIIVRIQHNVIEPAPIHRLRETVVRWLLSIDEDELVGECPKEMLLEKLHRSLGTLTTDEKIGLLFDIGQDATEIQIVEDTQTEAFYFYRNGFVTVSKSGIQLKPYTALPGFIWKDQILPRDFAPLPKDEVEGCFYARFARNVSECADATSDTIGDPARYEAFKTITGYNLHRFFNTELRATIFLDARVSDEPDGRSGKSLHAKAMQAILNADPENGKQSITIDGKNFDPVNRFKYDQIDISTKLVVFDDVKRSFNIEDLFNIIVDGFVRERKGEMHKIRVHSKIIFTLNYTLSLRSGSARARAVEFEFADYYSERFSPVTEFGHRFFRDWSPSEWMKFDNWMLNCVQDFMTKGLIIPQTINLEARKLRDGTAPDFITFMEDENVQHEQRFVKRELYRKFLDMDEENRPRNRDFAWMKPKNFTDWLRQFALYRPEIAGIKELRSSGSDYVIFLHNAPVSNPLHLEGAKLFPGKSDKCKLVEGGAASDDKVPY